MIPQVSNEHGVITGYGVVSATAGSVTEFGDALLEGRSGLSTIENMNTAGLINDKFCSATHFDHIAFAAERARSPKIDRSSALVLKAWEEAQDMASFAVSESSSYERIGVFFGTTLGGSNNGLSYYAQGERDLSLLKDYNLHAPGYQICLQNGFLGPNYVFSSACTSSNLAIATGLKTLRAGLLDVAVVGGFDVLSEVSCAGFSVMRNVSPNLCRPFDKDRDGLVLGEGAAVLILESHAHAEERGAEPRGYLCGSGLTSDAFHMTAPDKSGAGATRCITEALNDSSIDPGAIGCVFAHGTGTALNDRSEALAIANVLGDTALKVPTCSIKSAIGHTLGAAGAMNAVAALVSSRTKIMPGTLNFRSAPEEVNLVLSSETTRLSAEYCLSNTFGFGGSNCSIIMRFAA